MQWSLPLVTLCRAGLSGAEQREGLLKPTEADSHSVPLGVATQTSYTDDEKKALLRVLSKQVARLTSVKHLDVKGAMRGAFANLAKVTQLTQCYFNFSLKGYLDLDTLDQQLEALSTLTSLDTQVT